MREWRWRNPHPSELAGVRGNPADATPAGPLRDRLQRRAGRTRVSFRVNDQNACDENPTGAVTRNVLANDVRLVQNTTTPGNGDEPGYGLTVAANGTISQ